MTRLASRSLDGDLNRPERAAMLMHLVYCRACRRYLRQLELVSSALQDLARRFETNRPLPGPCLPDAARERIKQAIKNH
jgi:hypothetical protein